MQVEKYLKLHQPIIYQTFSNELKRNTLSHAYLISGNPGTPLLPVATFLAKTILCDEPDPFACNSCITCLRIDDNNYPDFILFNGEETTIKKDAVSSIEIQFEKTAFEEKGIMIYVLHLVENMTKEAINAILKFLEEPGKNVYAFLTTNNENNVLPTILSRCQILRLKLIPREEIIQDAIEIGVPQEDAELLSYFYNDSDLIKGVLDNDEGKNYLEAKETLLGFMHTLVENDKSKLIYYVEHDVISTVKEKTSARFFFDMLCQVYEEIVNLKNHRPILLSSYDKILNQLVNILKKPELDLVTILKCRNMINSNVNIALLFDHLIYELTQE